MVCTPVLLGRPGGEREPLSSQFVTSFTQLAADADDDCLPDAWEVEMGLDPADNGILDQIRQGEYGDYDGDGLTNREEYLLGSDPSNRDSDGDEVSDYDEVHVYKTSPTESGVIPEVEVANLDITGYNAASTSGTWQLFDGGLIGNSFLGKIEWTFTVPSSGIWMLEMEGRLKGKLRNREELELGVAIDGKAMASQTMSFLQTSPSSLKVITPYLEAGQHTFQIDVRNTAGRRKLQVLSLKVLAAGGPDADQNGNPDWLDQLLVQSNTLVPVPSESFTSPLFIEGSTRQLGGASVFASSQTIATLRGLGDLHWFANIPLEPTGATHSSVTLDGKIISNVTSWVPWNALQDGQQLIRLGDALKIGAWLGSPDSSASVSITVDGTTYNLNGAEAFSKTFTQPGEYPVTVSYNGTSQPAPSIKVVSANFGSAGVHYTNEPLWLNFPAVPQILNLTSEPSLKILSTEVSGNGQKAFVGTTGPGGHVMAARLPNGGAIVALGTVTTVSVSGALNNDAAVIVGSTADGYTLLRTPIWVGGLPPGGRVVITIFRAGVTFPDGTTTKELLSSDFVEGVAYLDFRFPPGLEGGYCHYTDVYDAQNNHLGRK